MSSFAHDELSVLKQHLAECDDCRAAYADYVLSSTSEPSQGSAASRLLPWSPLESRRRRFLEAAGRQGLTFSVDALRADVRDAGLQPEIVRSPAWHWRWAVAAMLALGVGLASAFVYEHSRPDARGIVALLQRENAALRDALRQRTPSTSTDGVFADTALSAERERARASIINAGARIAALGLSLREASTKLAALEADAARATSDLEGWRRKVREAEQQVAALHAERDQLSAQREADATFMELQAGRIDRLSEQIRERDQTLARQQELLGADRDIRDLMGARNLHVIDVFDVDGRGKTRKTFGRAFYTEGKSLIFYAFDLAGREPTRTSFQAWGHRTADERSTHSLGIFYSDDKAQNRWILKFEDPKVLEQIDSVFVTVEPPGGSTRPSGQKLLYAYLRNSPNHP